ncbi:MAG TPA: PH domain-containing protein [Thermoanaerobaculia bacterium]|nr:PH domain-containing protein [Thermoanaerobaculia bacterium]
MGYPERLLSGDEEIIRQFRPHWRMLAIPFLWTVLAAAAVAAAWLYMPDSPEWLGWLSWIITGVALVAWIRLALYPFVSWWFTLYVLTNERLITRSGILARRGLEIPLENINDVIFSQNILERILRSGDLVIESAGEMGQSRFSDIPTPEEFQSLIYAVREDRARCLAGAPSPGGGSVGDLERLAKLLKDGMISQEEYDAQKRRLLAE